MTKCVVYVLCILIGCYIEVLYNANIELNKLYDIYLVY